MKYFTTFLVISTLVPALSVAAFTAADSTCEGGNTIRFKVYDDGGTLPIGEVYADGAYDACCKTTCNAATKLVTGSNTQVDPSTFTATSTTCGGSLTGQVLEVRVVVVKVAGVIGTDDSYFTVRCDFNGGNTPTPIITKETFASKLQVITPAILQPDMVLKTDSGADIGGNTLALGDSVKIVVTLPSSVATSFEGVRVKACSAEGGTDNTQTVNLLDANGCTVGNNLFSSGFTGSGSQGTFKAESPVFSIFRFISDTTVVFKCTLVYCSATCNGDQCTTNTGRRRRSIERNLNRNVSSIHSPVYRVILPENRNGRHLPEAPGSTTTAKVPTHPDSLSAVPTIVWIGVVTILCAATSLLAMAVVYLLRARDEPKHKLKEPTEFYSDDRQPYFVNFDFRKPVKK